MPDIKKAVDIWNRLSQAARLLAAVERIGALDHIRCDWAIVEGWTAQNMYIPTVQQRTLAAALIALAEKVTESEEVNQ